MRPNIDEIRKRCEAATPGPWKDGKGPSGKPLNFQSADVRWSSDEYQREWQSNLMFIDHARTDIPALLEYVEELERRLAEAGMAQMGFEQTTEIRIGSNESLIPKETKP